MMMMNGLMLIILNRLKEAAAAGSEFHCCNFPPLESTAKSEESTAVESSLKDMSTSQLKSYASVTWAGVGH